MKAEKRFLGTSEKQSVSGNREKRSRPEFDRFLGINTAFNSFLAAMPSNGHKIPCHAPVDFARPSPEGGYLHKQTWHSVGSHFFKPWYRTFLGPNAWCNCCRWHPLSRNQTGWTIPATVTYEILASTKWAAAPRWSAG